MQHTQMLNILCNFSPKLFPELGLLSTPIFVACLPLPLVATFRPLFHGACLERLVPLLLPATLPVLSLVVEAPPIASFSCFLVDLPAAADMHPLVFATTLIASSFLLLAALLIRLHNRLRRRLTLLRTV